MINELINLIDVRFIFGKYKIYANELYMHLLKQEKKGSF